MGTFADFLKKNTINNGGTLPLLHTTKSYHLKKIMSADKLIARECDVFKPDKLNYFFVGRPAYKFHGDVSDPVYWELPCCFIFNFHSIGSIKRIFPFDSGAFVKRRYPSFIRDMPSDEFQIGTDPTIVSKVVGAFFGDVRSYFRIEAKSAKIFEAEFMLDAFDEEVQALHKLASIGNAKRLDDRRFTIEIQSDSDVDLTAAKPLAVIAPLNYYDNKKFHDHVTNVWKAIPIGYPIYTLSLAQYYYAIYERVEGFFKQRGYL